MPRLSTLSLSNGKCINKCELRLSTLSLTKVKSPVFFHYVMASEVQHSGNLGIGLVESFHAGI